MLEEALCRLRRALARAAFVCPALLPIALVPQEAAPQADSAAALAAASSGEIVITEFMKDPAAVIDTRGEWVEIYNPRPWRVNLEGWGLGDDSGIQHVISNGGQGVYVAPGQYFVLGRNGDPALNGGVAVDYVYTTFTLNNGADQIALVKPSGEVADRVAYDDLLWPTTPGRSISLTGSVLGARANDDPSNWCHSAVPLAASSTDTGTPGAANEFCP